MTLYSGHVTLKVFIHIVFSIITSSHKLFIPIICPVHSAILSCVHVDECTLNNLSESNSSLASDTYVLACGLLDRLPLSYGVLHVDL